MSLMFAPVAAAVHRLASRRPTKEDVVSVATKLIHTSIASGR